MRYIEFYQNTHNCGYHVDLDYAHIPGDHKDIEELKNKIEDSLKMYNKRYSYPAVEVVIPPFKDKPTLRIFFNVNCKVEEFGSRMDVSFTDELDMRLHEFIFHFWESDEGIHLNFEVTRRRFLF